MFILLEYIKNVPNFLCLIREKAVKTTSVTLVPKEGEG